VDFESVWIYFITLSNLALCHCRYPELKAIANEQNEPVLLLQHNTTADRYMDKMMYALFIALKRVANDQTRAIVKKLVFHPSRSTRRVIVANKITEALMMLLGVSIVF
jgi:hypothetical protein